MFSAKKAEICVLEGHVRHHDRRPHGVLRRHRLLRLILKEIQPAVSTVLSPDCSLLLTLDTNRSFSNTEGRRQRLLSPGVDANGRVSNLVPLMREGAVVQVVKETPSLAVEVALELAILHHQEGCSLGHIDSQDFPNSVFSCHRYHHGVACHGSVQCTLCCIFERQILEVVG